MNMKLIAATAAIVAAGAARGQIYQPAVRGNVLDASPQIGAGGVNSSVRPYGTFSYGSGGIGNLYITGNVSAGKQFRGFVPYSDPTQFQAPLGSSALNSFEGDAPNLNRIQNGYNLSQAQPFYATSSTLLPLSAQRYGLTIPGSSMPRTQVLPQPESYGGWALHRPPTLRPEALPEKVRPGDILVPMIGEPEAAMLPSEAVSPFEPSRPLTLPQKELLQKQEEKEEAPTFVPPPLTQQPPEQIQPGNETQPQDFTTWLEMQAQGAEKPHIRVGPQPEYAESARRLAMESKLQPTSKPAAQSRTELGRRIPEPLSPPVVTELSGRGTDAFSRSMRAAQRLINQGRFYDAYQQYARALTIKPNDPLPLFGQANALLAAGELRLAADHLQEALKGFPTFVRLKLDGVRLLGGRLILDRRREQLSTLVKKGSTPQLQLLLGYAELLSGDRQNGLTRMAASGLALVQ